MKNGVLFIKAALLFCFITGCSFMNEQQEITTPANTLIQKKLTSEGQDLNNRLLIIATGDMSGVYFSLGQVLSNLYEKYNGAVSGTQVTHASIENTELVSRHRAEIGFTTVDVLDLPETNKSKLRALTTLYSNYVQIVTTNQNNIDSLEDLVGKRISIGTTGSGTRLIAERILLETGLPLDQLNLSYLSFSQSAEALRNGTIDVAFFSSGIPNNEIAFISNETNLSFIPVPEYIIDRLQNQYGGYTKNAISSDTYKGMRKNIQTISIKNVLLTYDEMSDLQAYNLVKTLYEHLPELQHTHPAASDISINEATKQIPIEYHQGAINYFTEQGIIH
ncbi:TAXI family TRAP transporter solute-binding subunit [Peribacillus sp. NPDC096540]|uniref:TAXI family TRAP transporter solute-binding subunit n=1 Tax=Peribacillus sp. NPDC096540 TaxID=3390612 RepID=UPI003D08740F